MGRQKSQQTYHKPSDTNNRDRRGGTLFIVGIPIGSPDDLTVRARTVLGQVSIVVAETPLSTRALLDHHRIAATVTGYRQGDEEQMAVLLDRLKAGHDVALVADSGMPVIYDPGRILIASARASGHDVRVVPGPSALTAAAALSGDHADRLLFIGRLPHAPQGLDRLLRELRREVATTVMFAPSSALPRILKRIRHILPRRRVTLAVDMTKPNERVYQGAPSVLVEEAHDLPMDAEVTLVLSGVRRGGR
jgi:16S rRNA (cytidine1402-2'-O)-methyltransferase